MAMNPMSVPFNVNLWDNGPQPGSFYNFPNISPVGIANNGIIKRTQSPSTSGTSVLGLCFNKGVIIAADTLGSYGSLARYRNCSRVMKVNDNTILGAGGDYADYQYLKGIIEEKVIEEECLHDNFNIKPSSLHCWITRILYNKRSDFNPLWTTFLVGGLEDGKPFLGHVDKLGTAFESTHIATGYGGYIALPMLRNAYDANPNMTFQQAKEVMVKCLEVLYYRDARSFYKYELAIIDENGARVEGPFKLESKWDIAHFVRE